MRSLSLEQVKLIVDAVNEDLTLFSAGALEKDFHLTEVLRALSRVESGDFKLSFCGGTSLVKAHGCLNRMSEDIDIKIVDQALLNKSATRRKLNLLKVRITKALTDADFHIETVEAKNENRFLTYNLMYNPVFPKEVSLRAEIKLEITYAQAALPLENLPIRSILLRDIGFTETELLFPCIALEQMQAEKVLSFLRRSRNSQMNNNIDDTLIRHIHDVHILDSLNLNFLRVKQAFNMAILEDVAKFKNQDSEFAHNPKLVLTSTLNQAKFDSTLKPAYIKFVTNLVAGDAPSFESAISTFSSVAEKLIETIN